MIRQAPPIWYPGINTDHPLAKGLVYAFPCWEDHGKRISDFANRRSCEPSADSITWKNTALGPAISPTNPTTFKLQLPEFNGGSGSYRLSINSYSWSLWVYVSSGAVDSMVLQWAEYNLGQTSAQVVYASAFTALRYYNNSGAVQSVTGFTLNAWNHLAFTRQDQGTQSTTIVYVNGKAQLTSVEAANVYLIGPNYLASTNGTTASLTGKLSNFTTYNRHLSKAEIAELYSDPWAIYQPPKPIVYFDFRHIVVTASGGAIAGGQQSNTEVYNSAVPTGGALAGGQQTNTEVFNSIIPSGGVVCSGQEGFTYDETGSGGAVCSGSATLGGSQQATIPTGGANGAGVAIVEVDYSPVASGGAIVWSPLFNDGTAYTRLLTIPAGKLIADVKGHVWPVTATVDPGTVYYGRITVTTLSGSPLPYKLVSYDYGTFTFYFRADASASVDNQFEFSWG